MKTQTAKSYSAQNDKQCNCGNPKCTCENCTCETCTCGTDVAKSSCKCGCDC